MPRLNLRSMDLKAYFPFLNRAKGSLPRGEMLALRPVRSGGIVWAAKPDGEPGASLTVPRRDDRIGQIISRVFQIPATKTIELDEFGAAVWEKCDGRHSVEQLVAFTCSAYKLNRRQAEVSVVTFMRMLAQRRLIGLDSGIGSGNGTANVHRSEQSRKPPRRGRRRH